MRKLSLISVLLFWCQVGCNDPDPTPTVDFTPFYSLNGVVIFQPSSTDADSFLWDFGDGGTSPERIPKYQYVRNGEYVVKVTAKGKGGQAVATKTIKVTSITGSVLFWMRATNNNYISVYVDDRYVGKITGYYSSGSAPNCGAQYCVTVSGLEEGTHYFEAKDDDLFPSTWESTVEVIGNGCTKQQLRY